MQQRRTLLFYPNVHHNKIIRPKSVQFGHDYLLLRKLNLVILLLVRILVEVMHRQKVRTEFEIEGLNSFYRIGPLESEIC